MLTAPKVSCNLWIADAPTPRPRRFLVLPKVGDQLADDLGGGPVKLTVVRVLLGEGPEGLADIYATQSPDPRADQDRPIA